MRKTFQLILYDKVYQSVTADEGVVRNDVRRGPLFLHADQQLLGSCHHPCLGASIQQGIESNPLTPARQIPASQGRFKVDTLDPPEESLHQRDTSCAWDLLFLACDIEALQGALSSGGREVNKVYLCSYVDKGLSAVAAL